jgi:magnesium-transporting ATPase (P-type)
VCTDTLSYALVCSLLQPLFSVGGSLPICSVAEDRQVRFIHTHTHRNNVIDTVDALLGYIFTYFGPLCFVLLVTISKEALDDYQRYKRDNEANSQLYQCMTMTGIHSIPSSKIRVGDMILLEKDQRVSV